MQHVFCAVTLILSGQDYSTDGMNDSLLRFLQHLREFGLVYQRKVSWGQMRLLFQSFHAVTEQTRILLMTDSA